MLQNERSRANVSQLRSKCAKNHGELNAQTNALMSAVLPRQLRIWRLHDDPVYGVRKRPSLPIERIGQSLRTVYHQNGSKPNPPSNRPKSGEELKQSDLQELIQTPPPPRPPVPTTAPSTLQNDPHGLLYLADGRFLGETPRGWLGVQGGNTPCVCWF